MKPLKIAVWGVGAMGAGIARLAHKKISRGHLFREPPGYFCEAVETGLF